MVTDDCTMLMYRIQWMSRKFVHNAKKNTIHVQKTLKIQSKNRLATSPCVLIFATSLHNVSSCVLSGRLRERMNIHSDCICVAFPHRGSSSACSDCQGGRRQVHSDCTCEISLRCVSTCASSSGLPELQHTDTGRICEAFFRVSFCALSDHVQWMSCVHSSYISQLFLLCVSSSYAS